MDSLQGYRLNPLKLWCEGNQNKNGIDQLFILLLLLLQNICRIFTTPSKASHPPVFLLGKGSTKIKLKKLAFDQKGGGGVGAKTNLLILFFIFLQTMNIASRLLDSWRTLKRNHISTIHTIIKSIKG